MALMSLSGHVLTAVNTNTYPDWVCIEKVIWDGATNVAHTLEINDKNGKSVLEPIVGGSGITSIYREIKMHGKWANGLLVTVGSGTVDIYLRQTPK